MAGGPAARPLPEAARWLARRSPHTFPAVALLATILLLARPVMAQVCAGWQPERQVFFGDLHVHTTWSGDGRSDMAAMLDGIVERGLEYVALTDHAEDLTINGASRDQMMAQRRRIEAVEIRARRAAVNFEKDQVKAVDLTPFTAGLDRLLQSLTKASSPEKRMAIEDFFWLIEEYKVSLFAQEVGTDGPVSVKRLNQLIEDLLDLSRIESGQPSGASAR